jgi:trigger factor
MKADLEKVSSLERKLNIEVPADKVMAAFNDAYKRVQKNAEIKGFRKGKAPITTIKSLFKDRVMSDVINDLIQKHYTLALDQHQLSPISSPTIDIASNVEENAEFKFTAQFEVRPDISTVKYEGYEVLKEKVDVSDEMVNNYLDNMRKRSAQLTSITDKRPIQKDDFVMIDFAGYEGETALDDVKGNDLPVKIGGGQFLPGFEDQLLGLEIGAEKSFDQAIPANYHHKPIAGKTIKFTVKVKDIKKEELPELNDEFAKKFQQDTLDALKKSIREELTHEEESRINEEFKKRLFNVLAEKNPVDIPPTLKEEQKKKLVDDFRHRMLSQGMSEAEFEKYQTDWAADFDKTATFMVHTYFIVDKIAKDHNLKATNEDMESKISAHAVASGIDINKLRNYYNTVDGRSRLSYQITEENVVKFLESKMKVKEVEKSKIKD